MTDEWSKAQYPNNPEMWTYQAEPTYDARLMRNIVLGAEFVMSHITHFYALAALDYVQGPGSNFLGGALPQSGPWTPDYNGFYYHSLLQRPVGEGLGTVWGEVILDYVQALHMRRMAGDICGWFGGRWPMFSNLVPGGLTGDMTETITHPRLGTKPAYIIAQQRSKEVLYRGVSGAPDWEGSVQYGDGTLADPNKGTILHFIKQHYIPLVQVVAAIYSNYDNSSNSGLQLPNGEGFTGTPVNAGQNLGQGCGNFLAYGVFHEDDPWPLSKHPHHMLEHGYWTGGLAGSLAPWPESENSLTSPWGSNPMAIKDRIIEYIDYSWYNDKMSEPHPRDPACGYTSPNRKKTAYSWVKAPRLCVDTPLGAANALAENASAGDTTIKVANTAGFDPGEYVLVGSTVGRRCVRLIKSVGAGIPGTLTLHKGVHFSHLAGETVQQVTPTVMEVGAFARMIVDEEYKLHNGGPWDDFEDNLAGNRVGFAPFGVCSNRPQWIALATALGLTNPAYKQVFGISAMDRHRAKVLEALKVALRLHDWLQMLTGGIVENCQWFVPAKGEGWGLNEAPRGALLHYLKIGSVEYNKRDQIIRETEKIIDKYQCVVPTTWNASPRDDVDAPQLGAIEQGLTNPPTPLTGVNSAGRIGSVYVPVEALRVVHSFDPCIACAVHTVKKGKNGEKAKRVNGSKKVHAVTGRGVNFRKEVKKR